MHSFFKYWCRHNKRKKLIVVDPYPAQNVVLLYTLECIGAWCWRASSSYLDRVIPFRCLIHLNPSEGKKCMKQQLTILHLTPADRVHKSIRNSDRERYPKTSTQVVQVTDFVTRVECKIYLQCEPQPLSYPLSRNCISDQIGGRQLISCSTQHPDEILDCFFGLRLIYCWIMKTWIIIL